MHWYVTVLKRYGKPNTQSNDTDNHNGDSPSGQDSVMM